MKMSGQNLYKNLNDSELLKQTLIASKREKDATLALLDYLLEVDSRKLYASVNACSSLFEFLVNELGFSEPAAADRVNTIRLMRSVPEVKEHLQVGKLTLTSASQIQRFANAEQKVHPQGKAISVEEKTKVVNECLGKSKREVEKTLYAQQSEPARIFTQEKVKFVTSERVEIKFSVDKETLIKVSQLKDLIGEQSMEKIFGHAMDALLLLERKKRGVLVSASSSNRTNRVSYSLAAKSTIYDASFNRPAESNAPNAKPADASNLTSKTSDLRNGTNDSINKASDLNNKASDLTNKASDLTNKASDLTNKASDLGNKTNDSINEASDLNHSSVNSSYAAIERTTRQLNSRFVSIELKRIIYERSRGQCEFKDPRTKFRCTSTYRLHVDHIVPYALGGKTELSNLRHLCMTHNMRTAIEMGLGRPDNQKSY